MLVLIGGIGMVGFVYVWFLTDWGWVKKREEGHEHHA